MDAGNFFFAVWQIGCALAPNVGSLIAFRFFAGLGGSGCLTIGGGIISDLFAPDQRGIATSLYSLGVFLPPLSQFLPAASSAESGVVDRRGMRRTFRYLWEWALT